MLWITEMNETKPIQLEDWFDEYVVVQPGQGTCYYLSSDITSEVVLVDKDGQPFTKPEKRIGFV